MGGANKCVFFSSATQTQQCVSFSLADGGLSALSDFRQAGVPIQLRGTIPSKIIVVHMKKAVSSTVPSAVRCCENWISSGSKRAEVRFNSAEMMTESIRSSGDPTRC